MAETTSFLLTSRDIRIRILRHTGLYRECPIRVSQERHRFSPSRHSRTWGFLRPCTALSSQGNASDPFCRHPRLPVALLRVCRQLYLEGTEILYGENKFVIGCLHAGAIQAIKTLSQRSKSMLQKLHISFGNPDLQGVLNGDYDTTINVDSPVFLSSLRQLQVLCDLFSCYRPGQLDLEISFSVSSIEGGLAILRTLHPFPPLSQVSFCTRIEGLDRLNSKWQALLRQHARELIHQPPNHLQFPFERLPEEIQFMILSHVVTTKSPILYDRLGPPHRRWCRPYDLRPPTIYYRGCCSKCRRYLSWEICRCTVGSSFSSSCICPTSDDGIFLVSKRIRNIALHIFYRSNKFLLMEFDDEVLSDIHHLLSKDSWIWRVKRLYIDTNQPPKSDDTCTWQSVLQPLQQWKRVTDGEVTFCFSSFQSGHWNPPDSMFRLQGFCRIIEQAGFESASVWIPKHTGRRGISGIDELISIGCEASSVHI